MTDYRLSSKAAQSLEDIFVYTATTFGQAQAEAYHEGFHRMFGLLADFPLMGQSADEYVPGMRKFRHQSHLIFYTPDASAITIQDLLHCRQDVRKHMFDD